MPSTPRSPSEHYAESERLLSVAESAGTGPGVQQVAALAGIGHALLAAAPRRARRGRRVLHGDTTKYSSPTDRWLHGDDQ